MKRTAAALVTTTVLAVSSLRAPQPAAAATTTLWSTTPTGTHLAFDPAVDVLRFDTASIAAADLDLADSAGDLAVSTGGKVVYLDDTTIGEISTTNVTFAGGSVLRIGDGRATTAGDVLGNRWSDGLLSTRNQYRGLGGPDLLSGGSAADRIFGGAPQAPIDHVSRVGTTGSPTASTNPSPSADGGVVAFQGGWTQFGSTNDNATDVLVRSTATGAVSDEHRKVDGTNGLSGSGAAQVSADGRYVVFQSSSQLLAGASPSSTIFRADTTSSAVTAVSKTTGNGAFANGPAGEPDLSADGRYVVFTSSATNLVPGSSGTTADVFRKDMVTGSVERVSTSTTGGDANADCSQPRISADGRYVVFTSAATNLSSQTSGGGRTDIFVRDAEGNELYTLTGDQPGAASSRDPDVSWDPAVGTASGAFVFTTGKALVAADTNNQDDVYAWSFSDAAFELVSATADGGSVALASQEPSISGDGRFVAFRSFSDQLAPGDANGSSDVYVKDRTTDAVVNVSRSAAGTSANGPSAAPEISLSGNVVAFETSATNLAATDANGNVTDAFLAPNPLATARLQGNNGNDTYVLHPTARDQVIEGPGGGADTARTTVAGTFTLPTEVENFVGTTGADVVRGNASNNRIDPGLGNDFMYDSAGNDTYVIDVNTDNLTTEPGAGGTDTIESPLAWTLQSFLENLTLTGSAAVNGSGNNANNVLTGNSANNVLDGAGGTDTYTGGGGADAYVITSSANVDVVTDFAVGTDKFRMRQSAWQIGDRDLLVEGATNRTGPGGFSAAAEYVVISKNLTSITMTNASAAIGSATSNYAVGARRVFMVDNGTSSQLLLFIASNADAKVSASELKPLMTFRNRNAMSVRDLAFVN